MMRRETLARLSSGRSVDALPISLLWPLILVACGGGGGGGSGKPETTEATPPKPPPAVVEEPVGGGEPETTEATPDVDDPPTGWRIEANSAIGLTGKVWAISMTNPPQPSEEGKQGSLHQFLGFIHARDMPPGRVKVMDLIVDDLDTNPDFKQWEFRLHGPDSRYFEIDGTAVYFTPEIIDIETEKPEIFGGFSPLYIELVGLDLAYEFTLIVRKNHLSHGEVRVVLDAAKPDQPGHRLVADTSNIGDLNLKDGKSLRFTYHWEKLGWHRPGDPPLLNGRTDQPYLEITGNGIYRLTVIAHDDLPERFERDSFTTKFTKMIKVDEVALRPQADPSPAGAVAASIHEHFPLTLPVYEFTGEGSWQLAEGGRDNALFRIDAATGKLWFNSQAGYRVLNYENPQDAGADNIYDIRVERTTTDGQREMIDLALGVTDIRYEVHRDHPRNWTYKIRYDQVRPLIEEQEGWTAEEKTYAGWLLDGAVWAMPKEGPLIITWSIADRYRTEAGTRVTRPMERTTPEEDSLMREYFNKAAAAYEAVINVKFVEVAYVHQNYDDPSSITGNGMIELRWNVVNNHKSNAAWPGIGAYVAITDHLKSLLPYYESTFLHELGHAMGLAHPFFDEKQGDSDPSSPSDFPRDKTGRTTGFDSIASYGRSKAQGNLTLTEKDIKVLQFLYGAPGTDYDGLQSLLDIDIPPPDIIDWL